MDGPSATRRSADGTLDLAAAARAVGVGHHEAADSVERRRERFGRKPRGEPVQLVLGAGERGCQTRHSPARGGRRRAQVLLLGRRVAQQQRDEGAPPPAALALEPRARLGVALDRVRRELLDVGEDRLSEQTQHLRVDVRAAGGLGQPPPGHARTHPIGGLQGVERAALPQLAAPEPDVDLAARARARGASNQLEELAQRLGDPGAHPASERALERASVGRHLAGDRGQDLVGDRLELGLEQVGDLRRQGPPGLR